MDSKLYDYDDTHDLILILILIRVELAFLCCFCSGIVLLYHISRGMVCH